MNINSAVITILCSGLCDNNSMHSLSAKQWSNLAKRLQYNYLQPKDIVQYSLQEYTTKLGLSVQEATNILNLLNSSNRILSALKYYHDMGIKVATRTDAIYPKKLQYTLKDIAPPMVYYYGNPKLFNIKSIGFVGSRVIDDNDIGYINTILPRVVSHGCGIVSGGAKGTDTASKECALSNGSFCVEYLAGGLMNRVAMTKDSPNTLLVSTVTPTANFSTPIAMMRNRYIYAHSFGTVVVKANYNKGGSWHGAKDCLSKRLCYVYCWNNPEYYGNFQLIQRGAIPIDYSWDGVTQTMPMDLKSEYSQLNFL